MKLVNQKELLQKLSKQKLEIILKTEIAIMKTMNDPNVIHLFEALEDPESKKVYLVMEFAKYGSICSELYWRRREKEYFAQNKSGRCTFKRHHSLKEILDIFAQLCRGLAYLHEKINVVHHDIKPDNILVCEGLKVKFSDFGISKQFDGHDDVLDTYNNGTKMFLPPESWKKDVIYGRALDIWALGITMYSIMYGKHPFDIKKHNEMELSRSVIEEKIRYPDLPNGELLPDNLVEVLSTMLAKDPTDRPTAMYILNKLFSETEPKVETNPTQSRDIYKIIAKGLFSLVNKKKEVHVEIKC